ncbi:MAG: putative DNA-binding domain-containing protein [Deltaproteobacteria bacterium]|nr:putative DNA-binding domain-containing protein [Deltaproteobacteria bacterium]
MSLAKIEAGFRALLLNREPKLFDGVDEARQRVYRDLVRNSLLGTLRRACPHAIRLQGALFDQLAARFLEEAPPTTRLVRDVPGQFTAWLMQEATTSTSTVLPAFAELCHFEALEIEVTLSETAAHPLAPLDDDAVPLLDPSARLAIYRYPVHRVTSSSTALPEVSPAPVVLLCFQRAEQFVVVGLSPAVAKLLMLVSQGQTLRAALMVLNDEATSASVEFDRGRVRSDVVDLQRRGALHVPERHVP